MKGILVVLFSILLVGCGGVQHQTVGIEESTTLLIRAESLVGLTVSIKPGLTHVIKKEDLTPYRMGVLGVTDKAEESLETVNFKVETGLLNITVSRGSDVILSRQMQFSNGQTRELRINH